MTIFKTYTGNAMLNNALMTIEALAKLKDVSEINSSLLLDLYKKSDLKSINKRLKSYTMLFTKNGPLHNDKTNGDTIYESLIKTILANFENDGTKTCEISGLKFERSFSDLYKKALQNLNFPDKEIQKKDTNIGRTWFPLIGGLGSDAQALPQAKFTVQIHPICIAILQFLPLSSLLYKGGILLIDSSNFDLSKLMIARNTKTLLERIQSVSATESIENVKNFAKGDYLSNVLEILKEKEEYEETYSDLNMWSFSNSGTGASCIIDRVPNSLIRKLQNLYRNRKVSNELKAVLAKPDSSHSLIESLEDNRDWFLLYPNLFGSGKKAKKHAGVSVDFLEAYYKEIGKIDLIPKAKYISGLIEKYKSKPFEKILEKSDAWNNPEYRIELYKVLLLATEKGEWSLRHHISILDHKDELPVKNNFYQLHKLIHFYTQNKIWSDELTTEEISKHIVYDACTWLISLIGKDDRANTTKSNLKNSSENAKVGYNRTILDALNRIEIRYEDLIAIFYDDNFNYRKYGINELLRIFFSQPEQQEYDFNSLSPYHPSYEESMIIGWKKKIATFIADYQSYYYAKYQNPLIADQPHKKFNKTVDLFIKRNDNFYTLLSEIVYNINQYIRENSGYKEDKWSMEDLLTTPLGNSNRKFCETTIKFLMKQKAVKLLQEKTLQM